jgi:hypothetical protein
MILRYWILFLVQTIGDLTILSHLIPILRQILGPGLNGTTPPGLFVYALVGVTLIQVGY